MATRMNIRGNKPIRVIWVKKRDELVERLTPRPCMVISSGLIFAGIGIPFLMAAGVLPVSLFLGFVGFALTATGGVLALIFCGEI